MTSKLNKNNIEINLKDIENIFNSLDLHFKPINIDFYKRSFIHKSYLKKTNENIYNIDPNIINLQNNSQELFEFVGDSLFNKCVSIYLYNRYKFHNLTEGNLTRLKQRIVDSKSIAKMARFINLQKFCIISSFVEKTNGRNTDKLMEDTFEAFVFSIFLDLGEQKCNEFIIKLIENTIDFAQINYEDINHKHQLLEFFQKHWKMTPIYKKIYEIGSPHNKTYKMAALDIFENIIGESSSSTKKEAEQLASKDAMILLEKIFSNNLKVEILSFDVLEINNCLINNIDENLNKIYELFLKTYKFFKITLSFKKDNVIYDKILFLHCKFENYKIYNDFLLNSARFYLERFYYY